MTLRLILTAVLLTIGSLAIATSDDSYNGNQCTGVFGTEAAGFTRSEYGTQSVMAGGGWVTCPLSRENDESNQDGVVTFFADPGVTCFLVLQQIGGIVTQEESKTSDDGSAPTVLVLQTDFSQFSTVSLTCAIPGGAVMQSYHYEETFAG